MKKEFMAALFSVLVLWMTWVSGMLVKLDAEVAVMRYKLFSVARNSEPHQSIYGSDQTEHTEPVPFAHWLKLKEKDKP